MVTTLKCVSTNRLPDALCVSNDSFRRITAARKLRSAALLVGSTPSVLLLVKHGDRIDSHRGHVWLSAWLSVDDGRTWNGGLVLDERKIISYPVGLQSHDDTTYISYDRNRATGREILLARFTEEDILAGRFEGPRSNARMLISRPSVPHDRTTAP